MRMKTAEETEKRMLDVIYRSAKGFHRIGLMDDETLRRFEPHCREPEFVPADLKALREREGASRADLAFSLGVSPETVAQWERGKRRPSGPALKLLSLAKANGLKSIA